MRIHVVQRGETLWLIARRYGIDINRIVAVNELPDANRLAVGQALVIPANLYHAVKPGETLWAIAAQYGITANALIQANRIANPNLIYPGQILLIPAKPKRTIEVNAYIIQFGAEGGRIVSEVGDDLTYICPFGYRISSDGSLSPVNDTEIIQEAVSKRIVPILSITNFSATEAGSQLAHTILASPELQNKLIDNILTTMRAKGYRGLNVDFENVLPSDREA